VHEEEDQDEEEDEEQEEELENKKEDGRLQEQEHRQLFTSANTAEMSSGRSSFLRIIREHIIGMK